MSTTVKSIQSLREQSVTSANERQVGGEHYATPIQHWDFAAANHYDYFQGQITKYVDRWRRKNGIQDLEKAAHFLQKYIEVERVKEDAMGAAMSEVEHALAIGREGA